MSNKTILIDRLDEVVKAKHEKEALRKLSKAQELEDLKQKECEYIAKIRRINEIESNNKERFRDELIHQIHDNEELRRLRAEAEKDDALSTGSSKIRAEIERERRAKDQYRHELEDAIQAKKRSKADIEAERQAEIEKINNSELMHNQKLAKIREIEAQRKEQFKNDIQNQIEEAKLRNVSTRDQEAEQIRRAAEEYQKQLEEEHSRDLLYKSQFRNE